MRLAVPISVACCASCHTSFNWAEYGALDELDTKTRRRCDQCDAPVLCAGYESMQPERLWRSWELHQTLHPDTRRQPTMIPENRGDRMRLWWMSLDKLGLVLPVLSVAFLVAVLAMWAAR